MAIHPEDVLRYSLWALPFLLVLLGVLLIRRRRKEPVRRPVIALPLDRPEMLQAAFDRASVGVGFVTGDGQWLEANRPRFVFENGQLIACSSDRDERLFGQLRVDAGVIDEAQRGAALETHRATGVPFGSSIVKLGLATEDHVAEIIRTKAKKEIADAAAWQQAEWAFTANTVATAEMVPIAIDMLAVLAELTPAIDA